MSRDGLSWAPTGRLLLVIAVAAAAATQGYRIGDGNIDRLPNHRGYYLVAVNDPVEVAPAVQPRHAVVVVVDGLRLDEARRLGVIELLRKRGQCRPMDNGALTISRPMYSVLSSGLEVDRTGSRNNDLTTPSPVESVWQNAREAGRSVTGYSDLSWWEQLFPDAWDRFVVDERPDANFFALASPALTDVTLIHPVYVDHAGHASGAASAEYAAAAARLDGELSAFLETIDFDKDLVILAADHGHVADGGHGGPEEVVSRVELCFAGVGVSPSPTELPLFDARSFAPTLAVLLGVRFPAHMRAGDDHLDQIWSVASAELGEAYIGERKRSIERFRAQNGEQLRRWLGGDGSWNALYDRERTSQKKRAFAALLMIALGFVVFVRLVKMGWRRGLVLSLWMAATVAIAALLYTVWRGGLGFNSINSRALFLRASLVSSIAASAAALAIHLAIRRSAREAARDLCALAVVCMGTALAHLQVYGEPFGFPLPSDAELFFPFFASALIIAAAVTSIATALVVLATSAARSIRSRR